MRTLQLTYAITFSPEAEARAAAERINEVHRRVHGLDPVTGRRYDALDPDLLLWVHATLVDSALEFERRTVGRLDDAGRQRFHEEQMLVAEMLLLPRDRIPPTPRALRAYIDEVVAGGDLIVTPAARRVAMLFREPPPEAIWRPVLRAVSRWAFGTLPPRLRRDYGTRWNPLKEAALRGSLAWVRTVRPLLPERYREIEIARRARGRAASQG